MAMHSAVLLIGHGSRKPRSRAQFQQVLEKVRDCLKPLPVLPAFLELCAPRISDGIEACVEMKARRILAIPVFLSDARHVKEDIPRVLEAEQARYPDLSIRYARPLGGEDALDQILIERLRGKLDSTETGPPVVLLVGRGSSDPAASRELERAARVIRDQVSCRKVLTAYADHARPSVPEGLAAAVEGGPPEMVVLPYLLFPGAVLDRICESVAAFRRENAAVSVTVAGCLGDHPGLVDLLVQRIREEE